MDGVRRIAVIVEGHGEVDALPVLIRRIATELVPGTWVDVPRPIRIPRDKMLRPHGVEGVIEELVSRLGHLDGLLILFDADDDCPATLGPELLARARIARPDARCSVVLAQREFEAWFLASATSLRGKQGLSDDLEVPAEPEKIRGCKDWLTKRRPRGLPYQPTTHQAGLAAAFDMDLARENAASFDKFWRDVAAMLTGEA